LRGAEIAVNKGIFVLIAAGNSGEQTWHYITTPADNAKVFSIGSVDSANLSSAFSSYGPNSREQSNLMLRQEEPILQPLTTDHLLLFQELLLQLRLLQEE
jgi:subtilisin family serine protease